MAWKKDDAAARQGGVLGLGGANPPKDHIQGNSNDPEVTGTSGAGTTLTPDPERVENPTGSLHRGKGATSIDMGAGGDGNDIKP